MCICIWKAQMISVSKNHSLFAPLQVLHDNCKKQITWFTSTPSKEWRVGRIKAEGLAVAVLFVKDVRCNCSFPIVLHVLQMSLRQISPGVCFRGFEIMASCICDATFRHSRSAHSKRMGGEPIWRLTLLRDVDHHSFVFEYLYFPGSTS